MSIKTDLQCLHCSSRSFTARTLKITIKDKQIKTPAWVCDDCFEPLMDSDQMNVALNIYKTYTRDEF